MFNLTMPLSILVFVFTLSTCSYAQSEVNGPTDRDETYLNTHSVTDDDSGDTYDVKLYYSEFYKCLRVEVCKNGKIITGLFNRFYRLKPIPDSTARIRKSQNGKFLVINMMIGQLHENGRINHTIKGISLIPSSLNTDIIYDTVEAFVGGSCYMVFFRPPGFLKKTCIARIFGKGGCEDYLVTDEGKMTLLSNLEGLRRAYFDEGIEAYSAEDIKNVSLSLIDADTKFNFRGKANIISDTNDIPGYSQKPLEFKHLEDEIKAAWHEKDLNGQIEFWNCYTYNQYHGVVAHYKFGFQNNKVILADKRVLGEGVGRALYLCCEKHPKSSGTLATSNSPSSSTDAIIYFSAFGMSLLGAISYLLWKRHHSRQEKTIEAAQNGFCKIKD